MPLGSTWNFLEGILRRIKDIHTTLNTPVCESSIWKYYVDDEWFRDTPQRNIFCFFFLMFIIFLLYKSGLLDNVQAEHNHYMYRRWDNPTNFSYDYESTPRSRPEANSGLLEWQPSTNSNTKCALILRPTEP